MNELRVVVECGPKGKKFAAVAPDWPGLQRGAKSPEEAVARLVDYAPRYRRVAKLAKLDDEFGDDHVAKVLERYTGTGSTDFWGISFGFSSIDQRPMSSDELERELSLMRACWTYFDRVRSRVSSEMRKGPRGGGRDRDRIVRHTFGAEQDFARKLKLPVPSDEVITDPKERKKLRDAYCGAIRQYYAEDTMARSWPLRYLIRHTAFHTMDHAWEMEDKDLT
ncbi:MAG: hypothetical protein WCF25_04390 [Acidimicrobiales bacterium]